MWFRVVPKDMHWRGGKTEYHIEFRTNPLKDKWKPYAITYEQARADRICRLLENDEAIRLFGA